MIFVEQKIDNFTDDNAGSTVPVFDDAATYAVGDLVRVGSYQYKSTLADNLGNNPLETLNLYWIEWLPANDYAILDLLEDTKTEWVEDGMVEFLRGRNDTLGIGNFKATKVTIQYLDADRVELAIEEYLFSANGNVWDEWDYGYAEFTDSVDKAIYMKLKRLGVYIKVTFSSDGNSTNCGFLIAGVAVDMGRTLDEVSFPDKRLGDRTVNTASFNTILKNTAVMRKTLQAKRLVDTVMMFVIDPSETSKHDNMIILGKITKCDSVASKISENQISWQIDQMIQE